MASKQPSSLGSGGALPKAPSKKIRLKRTDEFKELQKIHLELSHCLDLVSAELKSINDLNSRVCCAVLEEDLEALVSECEDLMLSGERPALESLEARSETVLDELKSLFRI